ncbi:MAG: restriction endonuclease subunit M [Ruminococcaceae bacterium]|nr:restriction endonuclease subunit M [Oscillospiraceae bacterium]
MKKIKDIKIKTPIDIDLRLLEILLADRTTGQNIVWADSEYELMGEDYDSRSPIMPELIRGSNFELIKPRAMRYGGLTEGLSPEDAEKFVPAWLCNERNNLLDEEWFGRKNVFNEPGNKRWEPAEPPIKFPDYPEETDKSWQDYVDERRIEINCGEAPHLVSRYDVITGKYIKVKNRIGMLDRKFRVASENVRNEIEWRKWSKRAVQSVYGYEFRGDSLLIARLNLFYSYVDFSHKSMLTDPTEEDLREIAEIISWNIWQMDGKNMTPPYIRDRDKFRQTSLFGGENEEKKTPYCRIMDWQKGKETDFIEFAKG